VYLFTVLFPYIRVYLFDYGPAPQLPLRLSSLWRIPNAYANNAQIEILALSIDQDRSSFEDVIVIDQSADPMSGHKIRTFQYNQRVDQVRECGDCLGVKGNQLITQILTLLEARLRKNNRLDLLPYVNSLSGYRKLMSKGGENFLDIMFSQNEILKLRKEDPSSFEHVAEWLVNCVGVTEPVITLIVRNNSDKATAISKVSYIVDTTLVVLGGGRGPAVPEYTYRHSIPHAKGVHIRNLNPPFIVDARSIGIFSIALSYEGSGRGRTWLMRLRINTLDNQEATSERFQLILSK
jgi:hypothetical protein